MRKYPSAKDLAKLTKPGRYAIGHGAYLQIARGGTRSWVLRYRSGNRCTHMGLGPCDYVTLQEARDKAIDAQRQRLNGIDPLNTKRAARAKNVAPARCSVATFERCALDYIAAHEPKWKGSASSEQWGQSLRTYVFPSLGSTPVDRLKTPDILNVLTPIWSTIPETARRIQKRIELILDYATAHGMRQGDNPARWGTLKHILPELRNGRTNHHPALRYKDLPAFMMKLRPDCSVQSLALQFVILTACRIGEALGASWSEFEGGTWNIPAERMKGARAHRVALSRAALEVLERLPRVVGESHLFPGRGGAIRPLTVQRLLKALVPTGATLHGFRATFSTWANEQTKTPPHIVESCLAHQVSGAVERSYNRSDWLAARAVLLEQWGRYCFPDDRG